MEKQVKREVVFEGKVVRLYKDDVLIDDEKIAYREVVEHYGGACIALKSKDDKYYMVRQYRYAQGMEMLEFCAGKLEKGEDPRHAILRESEEELGFKVENLKEYGYMVPTCGYSSERIYLYSGEEGDYVGKHLDEDERLNSEKYSLEEIEKMIMSGQITDAKTICLVYYLKKGK